MDPCRTGIEVVQEGVQEVMEVLNEYNEISRKFMEPMDDEQMNALTERQGELSEKIEHPGGREIDANIERDMAATHCPPPEPKISTHTGGDRRRVAQRRDHPRVRHADEDAQRLLDQQRPEQFAQLTVGQRPSIPP